MHYQKYDCPKISTIALFYTLSFCLTFSHAFIKFYQVFCTLWSHTLNYTEIIINNLQSLSPEISLKPAVNISKLFHPELVGQLRQMQLPQTRLVPRHLLRHSDEIDRLSAALRRHGIDCSSVLDPIQTYARYDQDCLKNVGGPLKLVNQIFIVLKSNQWLPMIFFCLKEAPKNTKFDIIRKVKPHQTL